jgi:predicted small secreted protein
MNRVTMMRMLTLVVAIALAATMLPASNTIEGAGHDVHAAGPWVAGAADAAKPR